MIVAAHDRLTIGSTLFATVYSARRDDVLTLRTCPIFIAENLGLQTTFKTCENFLEMIRIQSSQRGPAGKRASYRSLCSYHHR